jgi:hypothetical protein
MVCYIIKFMDSTGNALMTAINGLAKFVVNGFIVG